MTKTVHKTLPGGGGGHGGGGSGGGGYRGGGVQGVVGVCGPRVVGVGVQGWWGV